jgi:hypothetical protein
MITTIQKTCNDALDFIRSQQQSNGGFLSTSWKHGTFYTSLILSTGAYTSESAIQFLLNELSDHGTINYWQRGSTEYTSTPYPDDLDDTFVAMQALHTHSPISVSEEMMAHLTNLLISQETDAGGPYRTWITDDSSAAWQDVDIVVNSNIAAFLLIHDIHLPPLQKYIDEQLLSGLKSKYYHDEITILYFLAKAYEGSQKKIIVDKILALRNSDGNWNNPQHTAYAVSALLRLGIKPSTLTRAVQYIIDTCTHGQWSHVDIFIEQISKDEITYSGCGAYTSACCIEALKAFERISVPKKSDENTLQKSRYIASVHEECRKITVDPFFSAQLYMILEQLETKDPSGEIAMLPYLFAEQMKQEQGAYKSVAKETVIQLSVANTLGWIGYSIYDSILDGEPKVWLLPLANTCTKAMVNIFKQIASVDAYRSVQRILEGIDSSTFWEHVHCKYDFEEVAAEELPYYGNHNILAEKSLGHALGPILLCHLAGESEQAKHVEDFFTHYLIARQLNDDAHDWQEDLQNGFVNSVSVGMLRETSSTDIAMLQEYFWEHHIDAVASLISEHILTARSILKKITILKDVTFLEALLIPLEQSSVQALSERNRTKKFLKAFS